MKFEERVIDDPGLEALLEERQEKKDAKKEATDKFKELDGVAKAKVVALELGDDEEVRCGQFMLSYPPPPDDREVAFTRSRQRRPRIRLLK